MAAPSRQGRGAYPSRAADRRQQKEASGRNDAPVAADRFRRAGAPTRAFTIAKPNGARAFEVVGIPLPAKGFHVVELASPRLGSALLEPGKIRYVATGALVTDMAVHFQWTTVAASHG